MDKKERVWMLSVELTPHVHPVLVSAAPVDEILLDVGPVLALPSGICGIHDTFVRDRAKVYSLTIPLTMRLDSHYSR